MTTKTIIKSSVFLSVALAPPQGLCAQSQLTREHNSMRIGDAVKMYKIQTDDVWNLANAKKSHDAAYASIEDFKADSVTFLFNGTRKYYVLHSDSLLYLGAENPLQIDSFYIPEVSCVFPMRLKGRHDGVFACYTDYCDKMRFHKYGTYTAEADTVGTLILPDESAVRNVMQIRRTRRYMYERIDTVTAAGLPAYGAAEILLKQGAGAGIYTEVERQLYAKGHRYPIVWDCVLRNPDGEVCKRETYYKPVDDDEGLNLDEANVKARSQAGEEGDDAGGGSGFQMSAFVRKNAETKEILFDCGRYASSYPTDGKERCKMLLSDIRGFACRLREFALDASAQGEVGVSYAGLRRGHYVMHLTIADQTYTENFIIE